MSLRRSSRRLTVTGSTVFGGYTPQVPRLTKENVDFDSSPKWVAGEDAFTELKTPKLAQPTRRTTMTRQNIFHETIAETNDEEVPSKFKVPSFFIPISPPGVKTRKRRASMVVGTGRQSISKQDVVTTKPQTAKGKATKSKSFAVTAKHEPKGKTTVSTGQINKAKRTYETETAPSKLPVKTAEKSKFGEEAVVNVSQPKKSRRSTRITLEPEQLYHPESDLDSNGLSIVEDLNSKQVGSKSRKSSHVSPKASIPFSQLGTRSAVKDKPVVELLPAGDAETIQHTEVNKLSINEALQVVSLSQVDVTPMIPKTAKSQKTLAVRSVKLVEKALPEKVVEVEVVATTKTPVSRVNERKRLISKEEDEQIDSVVKKMISLSPKTIKDHHKLTSPNISKKAASPARGALIKEGLISEKKLKSPGRKGLLTPSRAAPKARKILGVTNTPLPSESNIKKSVAPAVGDDGDVKDVSDDNVSASAMDTSLDIGNENEHNLTLSHTSHSQWCTIL